MASWIAQQLTPQERRFVELHVVHGLTLGESYNEAFPWRASGWNMMDERVCPDPKERMKKLKARLSLMAQHTIRRPKLQKYVMELQDKLAEIAQQQAFLSFEEKRKFLAKVVRTPVGEVDENSELAQEVKQNADGSTTVKMPGKLQAIEMDARLMAEFRDSLTIDVNERVINLAAQLI